MSGMNIKYFIRGYVRYKIKTKNPYRLINKLKTQAPLRKVRFPQDNIITFITFYDSKDIVAKTVVEYGDEIVNSKCKGLTYLFGKYKKRTGLFLGFVLSLLTLFFSTFFVWYIDVSGNENVKDEDIKRVLLDAGLREGMLKRDVNTHSVVNRYLIADDRISWLAINFEGMVAHVEVKEANLKKPAEKKQNVNLVASADAIIVRVDAINGQSAVSSGDVVTKGQLLVSAFVDKRTGGSSLRGASGFVWAKTSRTFTAVVPLVYSEMNVSKTSKSKYVLSLLDKDIFLGGNFGQIKDSAFLETKNVVCDGSMPFELNKKTVNVYTPYEKRRTKESALNFAREICKQRLYENTNNYTLIDENESYYLQDDKLLYTCTYDGVENIAKQLEFSTQ